MDTETGFVVMVKFNNVENDEAAIWGPFTTTEKAEMCVLAFANRPDVVSAYIIDEVTNDKVSDDVE